MLMSVYTWGLTRRGGLLFRIADCMVHLKKKKHQNKIDMRDIQKNNWRQSGSSALRSALVV